MVVCRHPPHSRRSDHGGLQDQGNRLRDGHEVPFHLLVGHRQRLPMLQLIQEQGQDAPTAAQDIAEPHRNEPGIK